MQSIGVFCSSNLGKDQVYTDAAIQVGELLSKKDIKLVYGGANVGLMRIVAETVLKNHGKAIGVITHFLAKKHLAQSGLEKLILVDTMQERKAKMTELSDGFIILPGGCGTMEEFFEVYTAAQLGFHKKPIVVINTNGYYNNLKNLLTQMLSERMMLEPHVDMVGFFDDINEAFEFMDNYQAPVMEKWIDDIKTANGHLST